MRKPINQNVLDALAKPANASDLREFYESGKRINYGPPRFAAKSQQTRRGDQIKAARRFREQQRAELMRGHDA